VSWTLCRICSQQRTVLYISAPGSFGPVIYLHVVLHTVKHHFANLIQFQTCNITEHFAGSACLTDLWTTRYSPGSLAGSLEFDLSYPATHGASAQSHLLRPEESAKDILIHQRHSYFTKCFRAQNLTKLCKTVFTVAMPRLRHLVTGLSPHTHRLYSRSVHVRSVVNKAALGQVFLPVLHFSPVTITPPMHHTHAFSYHHYIILAVDSTAKQYT
jgi:hypothetical protein